MAFAHLSPGPPVPRRDRGNTPVTGALRRARYRSRRQWFEIRRPTGAPAREPALRSGLLWGIVVSSSLIRLVSAACLSLSCCLAAGCATNDALAPGPTQDVVVTPDTHSDVVIDVVKPVDVAPADIGPTCPGGAGCTCTKDADCPGSACAASPTGKTCAAPCKNNACAAGTICRTVQVAVTPTKLCLPRNPTLCDPCSVSSTCATPADPNAHCVALQDDQVGAGGWFCAPTCASTTDCPSGFLCTQTARVDGDSALHCLPGTKTCDCSPAASASAAKTTCFHQAKAANGQIIGSCKGTRTCNIKGLTPCSAPTPIAETCDGLDNNCSGQKDEGSLCDDGNACTTDSCAGGAGCAHDSIAAKCDDGNPCTDDSCDKGKGCVNVVNTAPCSDGTACTTGDVCGSGACKGKVLTCDDNNLCTDDSCDKTSGCVFTPVKKPCNDANACTTGDICAGGKCNGFPIACDDKNLCTDDACDVTTGCTAVANAKPCNDGSICTLDDVCAANKCDGKAISCDDGKQCTADVCDPKLGCTHSTLDGEPCNDGDACTAGETCNNATCVTGKPKDCDDGNPCSVDTCNPIGVGCSSATVANGITCSDGNVCTTGDACASGKCAGATLVCDDGNPCTLDGCDSKFGCTVKAATGGSCEDGNPCTAPDLCKSGDCTAGLPLDATACGAGKVCAAGVCK